jgi:hypothetical protein
MVLITTHITYQQAQPEASAPKQGFQYTVRLSFQHKQWHPDFFQFVVPLYVFLESANFFQSFNQKDS